MDDRTKTCYAHYNRVTNQYQSIYVHTLNTANISDNNNSIPLLKNIAWLTAVLHDCGKFSDEWQKYFLKSISGESDNSGAKPDHSTAGGQVIERLSPRTLLSQMAQTAIYSHHGLQDCISAEDKSSLFVKRGEKGAGLPIAQCEQSFFSSCGQADINERCRLAEEEGRQLKNAIQDTLRAWGGDKNTYGNRDFFLGMYERILMSLLIDADRRDTEDFMAGAGTKEILPEEDILKIWEKCCRNVEKRIHEKSICAGNANTEISDCRNAVSKLCRQAAEEKAAILQLCVPTGAGKTLGSLRFAVNYALRHKKKRIIYAAPYNSIVEQNAREIRDALDMPGIVLEHHCNIVQETEEEQRLYDRVTEDWSPPVIVTSAVQLLNTLFSEKTGNVRRMHSLCDSVIIMDEVQALPVCLLELFNMAVNFLSAFAGAAVVLCTATQPLLDKLPVNRLLPPRKMIEHSAELQEKLRRTEIVDSTAAVPGGMDIGQAAQFALEKAEKYRKVLFIVNTKACARNMFQLLKRRCAAQLCGEETEIFHLSTSMCPEHRIKTLKALSESLKDDNRRLICVSTQLIEAGVDISFRCVIRSLAGLDSIIQAAGRCNRNREEALGHVFIVRLDGGAEDVSRLWEIYTAQGAVQPVLEQFRRDARSLGGRLDSDEAVSMYFDRYFHSCQEKMCYPVTVNGGPTSIVRLLSDNPDFTDMSGKKQLLKQAFKTAGSEFSVIEDAGKITVVVKFDERAAAALAELESRSAALKDKRRILRRLQPYTAAITEKEKEMIGTGIRAVWENQVLVLDNRFYDGETGVVTDPKIMDALIM